jgi:hypothetical protein
VYLDYRIWSLHIYRLDGGRGQIVLVDGLLWLVFAKVLPFIQRIDSLARVKILSVILPVICIFHSLISTNSSSALDRSFISHTIIIIIFLWWDVRMICYSMKDWVTMMNGNIMIDQTKTSKSAHKWGFYCGGWSATFLGVKFYLASKVGLFIF